MKWRFHVGNLSGAVTQDELKEKFSSLFSSYPEVRVSSAEIRCKNDKYFAYLDIHWEEGGSDQEVAEGAPPPPQITNRIRLISNTTWKGSFINVQLAKEDFIGKLRREREEGERLKLQSQSKEMNAADAALRTIRRQQRPRCAPTEEDNTGGDYDFEIVSSSRAEQVEKPKATGKESEDESSQEEEEEESADGIPKFRGLLLCYPNGEGGGVHRVGSGSPEKRPSSSQRKPQPPVHSKEEVREETEEQDEEELARFHRLQRIAGYPTQAPVSKSQTTLEKKEVGGGEDKADKKAPLTKGVVFRKSKQERSDLLRVQSFDRLQEIKAHQKSLIKSSLSGVAKINSTEFPSSAKRAASSINLFGDEEEAQDDDYGGDFKVKRQYEGEEGQRLLALKGGWAFDSRFNIDSRFNEERSQEHEGDDEKGKQLDILSSVLGTGFSRGGVEGRHPGGDKGPNNNKPPVILNRYDPEASELHPIIYDEEESERVRQPTAPTANSTKKGGKEAPVVVEEQTRIRTTDPLTYKMDENLKSLFSGSQGPSQTPTNEQPLKKPNVKGFSLLTQFAVDDQTEGETESRVSDVGAPRTFWSSNPFKYDSSDDEDEGKEEAKKRKQTVVGLLSNPHVSKNPELFFFGRRDVRLEGLEKYFRGDEDPLESRVEDYSEKRRELKSIVKAKARNAKRKDEKRTMAIKRAIRKKRKYRAVNLAKGAVNSIKLAA